MGLENNFTLCKEGWQLYDIWSRLLEDKAPKPEIRTAKTVYYNHRASCGTCTKPGVSNGNGTK